LQLIHLYFSLEIDIISKPKTSTVFAILSNTSLYLKFSKENAIIEIEKIEIIHKTNPIILNLLGVDIRNLFDFPNRFLL
jgi:hypothetical protein